MEEKIKELCKILYQQNDVLLEEKKAEIKKSKFCNTISFIRNIILCVFPILLLYGLFYFFQTYYFFYLFCFAIIGLLYFFIKKPFTNYTIKVDSINKSIAEYKCFFYENICKPIIENVIPNIQYDYNSGISEELYESMGFSNCHSLYYSTDNIRIRSEKNLKMSKIHTKLRYRTNGHYIAYYTIFFGIASINSLPFSLPINIRLRNNSLESLRLKNKIKTNNNEFNKYYELETDNVDLLKKYFNDKILTFFVTLAKENQRLELNMSQNHLFIRLHDKNFLEFNIKSKNIEQQMINSCNSIKAIIDTNNFLVTELKRFF